MVTHTDHVYAAWGEINEPHHLAFVKNMNLDSCVMLLKDRLKVYNDYKLIKSIILKVPLLICIYVLIKIST